MRDRGRAQGLSHILLDAQIAISDGSAQRVGKLRFDIAEQRRLLGLLV